MRVRKERSTAPPAPLTATPDAAAEIREQAALISSVIAAGMNGEAFATVLQLKNPQAVRAAAHSTVEEIIGYFTQDPEAKTIFDKAVSPDRMRAFAYEFQTAAKRMYGVLA